jgi:hypothetical protein
MGHDVQILGQHTLNTSTLIYIAADLAERLNATVKFGYKDNWVLDEKHGTFDFIKLGEIVKQSKIEYELISDVYMHRLDACDVRQKVRIYTLCDVIDCDRCTYIYEHAFNGYTSLDSRWGSFVDYFNGNDKVESIVKHFRICARREVLLLGGKHAIYYDDQGPSWQLEMLAENKNWHEIKAFMDANFRNKILNISDWMRNKERYKKKIEYEVFYEDFNDLK